MNLTPEQIASRLNDSNPFSTRFVRPGAISYHFPNSADAASLVELLRLHQWHGEIVGPHGSGKSTLIQTLIPALQDAGRDVRSFVLQAGETQLPIAAPELRTWGPSTQIIVDGYEQLGGWTRTLIHRICKSQGCGLLITCHKPTGLPVILRTTASLDLAQEIVREIQAEKAVVTDHDVELSFHAHLGNIREVLFELHDLYEQRRT